MDVHPAPLQDVLEGEDVAVRGTVERQTPDLVVADEVDVGADAAGDLGEPGGVLGPVVDAAEEQVLEGDLASGAAEVGVARVEESVERGVLGPRDEAAAEIVRGSVQAEGEGDGHVEVGEAADGPGKADGGHGDLSGADAQSPGGVDGPDGAGDGGEVRERLAHAHEHDVGDAVAAGQTREAVHLLDDLTGPEVPGDAVDARCAEAAPDGAAELARDARGPAAVGGDHDTLDLTRRRRGEGERAGVGLRVAEEKLLRAVGGDLVRLDAGRLEAEPEGEHVAVRPRDVRHRPGLDDESPVHPLEQLPGDVAGHSPRYDKRLELRGIEVEERRRLGGVDHFAVRCPHAVAPIVRSIVL